MTNEPLWEFFAVDEAQLALLNNHAHKEERIQATKRVQGRILMAIKPGLVPAYFDARGIEVRTMDYDREPFSGDLAITTNKLYLLTFRGDGMGIIVESREAVAIARALYQMVWVSAKLWTSPSGWSLV